MRIWLKDASFIPVISVKRHSTNRSLALTQAKTTYAHFQKFTSGKHAFKRRQSGTIRDGEARKLGSQDIPKFDNLTRKFAEQRRAAEGSKILRSEPSRPPIRRIDRRKAAGRRKTAPAWSATLSLPSRASEKQAKTASETAVATQTLLRKFGRGPIIPKINSPKYLEGFQAPTGFSHGPLIRKIIHREIRIKKLEILRSRPLIRKSLSKEIPRRNFRPLNSKTTKRDISSNNFGIEQRYDPPQQRVSERDRGSARYTTTLLESKDTTSECRAIQAQTNAVIRKHPLQKAAKTLHRQGTAQVLYRRSDSVLDIDTENILPVDIRSQVESTAGSREDPFTPKGQPQEASITSISHSLSRSQTQIDQTPSLEEHHSLPLQEDPVLDSGQSIKLTSIAESPPFSRNLAINHEVHSLSVPKSRQTQKTLSPAKETLIDTPNSVNEVLDSALNAAFWHPTTPSMLTHVKVITTPTVDTPGTLVEICFGTKRYLIGQVHEGAQRALLENGAKLAKYSDIFITGRVEWATTGGLLGCMLSMADVLGNSAAAYKSELQGKIQRLKKDLGKCENTSGNKKRVSAAEQLADHLRTQIPELQHKLSYIEKPHIRVHGGANLTYLLASSRRFILRTSMHVEASEYDDQQISTSSSARPPDWSDDRVQVWSMPIAADLDPPPQSPRKRSFAEYAFRFSDEDDLSPSEQTRIDSAEILDRVFNSDWTRRRLREIRLADVDFSTKVYLEPEDSDHSEPISRQEAASRTKVDNPLVWIRKPWPATAAHMPQTKPHRKALSYIFKTYPMRGKFQAIKARALGISPGLDFGRLTTGKSVVSKNGAVITPEMVLGESEPGRGVAIIDLPSVEYIKAFVKRPEWGDSFSFNIHAFFWILGPGVLHDQRIERMMKERDFAEHVVSSPETSTNYLAMERAASYALNLNRIDPDHFQVPHHQRPVGENIAVSSTTANTPAYTPVQRGLNFQLRPPCGFLNHEVKPVIDASLVLQNTPQKALVLAKTGADNMIASVSRETDLPGGDAEISFLGTGSASPSMHRNVSGTLLRVPDVGSYLFDCGEGTLGQLRRMYPPEQLSAIFQDLKMIWISHMHADHHLGITSVIKAWYQEVYGNYALQNGEDKIDQRSTKSEPMELPLSKKLCVIGTQAMAAWLEEWSRAEDFGYRGLFTVQVSPYFEGNEHRADFQYLCAKPSTPKSNPKILHKELPRKVFEKFGIKEIQTCFVDHCYAAHAVSLTFPDDFKFSYSGDCLPSHRFAEIGKDSTVLVHEATFDDKMQADAKRKKHSTISGAIAVGRAMKARRIMLTHFSQRYQKLPVISQQLSLNQTPNEEGFEIQADAAETQDDGLAADKGVTESDMDAAAAATNDDRLSVYQNATEASAMNVSAKPTIKGQSSESTESFDGGTTAMDGNIEATLDGQATHFTEDVDEDVEKPRPTVRYDMYGRGIIVDSEPRSDVYVDRTEAANEDTQAVTETRSAQLKDEARTDKPDATQVSELDHQIEDLQDQAQSKTSASIPQSDADDTKIEHTPLESLIPSSTADEALYDEKIGFAFDYMRVKVKDIEHLHHFFPAIEELFAAQEEGEESLVNEEVNRGRKKAKKRRNYVNAVATQSIGIEGEIENPAMKEQVEVEDPVTEKDTEVEDPTFEELAKVEDPVFQEHVEPMPAYPAFEPKSQVEGQKSEPAPPAKSRRAHFKKTSSAQPMPEYPNHTPSTSRKLRSIPAAQEPGTFSSSRILETLDSLAAVQDPQGQGAPAAMDVEQTPLVDLPSGNPAADNPTNAVVQAAEHSGATTSKQVEDTPLETYVPTRDAPFWTMSSPEHKNSPSGHEPQPFDFSGKESGTNGESQAAEK